MERRTYKSEELNLSYLDSGGEGRTLITLHSHWLEAGTFAPLAEALGPTWRVLSLDQRGHGYSDHGLTYNREDYLGDLSALFEHLQLTNAVILGNSLGGVNAYQFAAKSPERVRAVIIEDIGVVIRDDTSFALRWAGSFATFDELADRIGPRFLPYLQPSVRSDPEGWRLAFEPSDMVKSQSFVNGDHWHDWLASKCPALIIRGRESRVTDRQQLEEMAERRPDTQLVILPGGHVVHHDSPKEFFEVVSRFLSELPA